MEEETRMDKSDIIKQTPFNSEQIKHAIARGMDDLEQRIIFDAKAADIVAKCFDEGDTVQPDGPAPLEETSEASSRETDVRA
jgi:hypothetical protein